MAKLEFHRNNPNLPTPKTEYEYDEEKVKHLVQAQKNLLYFAENFFYIVTLDEGKQKIELYPAQKRVLKSLTKNQNVVLLASRQIGKALDIDTPVPVPGGWTTMGQLTDEDQLYDEGGNVCRVVKAHDVMHNRNCYEVEFDNGEVIVADEDHNWFTQHKSERKRKHECLGSVKTTKQIYQTLTYGQKTKEAAHRIVKAGPLQQQQQQLPIDPYQFGYWLGDGHSYSSRLFVGKQDIDEALQHLNLEHYSIRQDKAGNYDVNMMSVKHSQTNSVSSRLRKLGVIKNKHIPNIYLHGSYDQRLALLQGLMDSDGYVNKIGVCQFTSSIEQLNADVKQLIISLGFKVKQTERMGQYNGKQTTTSYILTFTPDVDVFRLSRKRERLVAQCKGRVNYHYIKDVRPVESRPVRCITVDSKNNLFLCGNSCIPTHNTTLMTIYALWVCCFQKDKRIMLLANKERTAIQIFERIRMAYEMLPNWIKPGIDGTYGKMEFKLENGSSIACAATSSSAVRGDRANCLILDELAFVPSQVIEEFWNSVIPVISSSSKTQIFCVSTPNGTQNKFYEIYTGAEREGKDWDTWTALRVDWHEVPGRGKKWKRRMIQSLGGVEAFEQEFGNKFIEIGSSPFRKEVFDSLRSMVKDPLMMFADTPVGFEPVSRNDIENPCTYQVWETPNPDHVYTMGVDCAEGVGRAAAVVSVLDITSLTDIRLVAQYHNRNIQTGSFAQKVHEIAHQFGRPWVLCERNNMGGEVINLLTNTHYYERIVNYCPTNQNQKYYNRLGIYSHTNSKYRGVANMRYWFDQVEVVKIFDIATIHEFETFVRHPNGTWGKQKTERVYDDRVDSIIWALFLLEPEIAQQHLQIISYDDTGKPAQVIDPYSAFATGDYDFQGFNQLSVGNQNPMPMSLGLAPLSGPQDQELNEMSNDPNFWAGI